MKGLTKCFDGKEERDKLCCWRKKSYRYEEMKGNHRGRRRRVDGDDNGRRDDNPDEQPDRLIAVDHINMSLYEDHITCLLGHNGAGKTTALRMLCGLLKASEGEISVYGKQISHELDDIRKMLGYCPQHDILFDLLTVEEHIYLYAAIRLTNNSPPSAQPIRDRHQIISQHTDQLLQSLSLTGVRYTRASKLSGGEKRKLSLACALVMNPKFVILDEPTK